MDAKTIEFLQAMAARNATGSAYARDPELALLAKLSDGIKEAFDLHLLYDEVAIVETDQAVVASLGEYKSQLGAFRRVAEELRAKIQEISQIRKKIDEIEERVGAPLLASVQEADPA